MSQKNGINCATSRLRIFCRSVPVFHLCLHRYNGCFPVCGLYNGCLATILPQCLIGWLPPCSSACPTSALKVCPNACGWPENLATTLPEWLTAWFPPLIAKMPACCLFVTCPNTWQQVFLNVKLPDFPVYCKLPAQMADFPLYLPKLPACYLLACCLPQMADTRQQINCTFLPLSSDLFICWVLHKPAFHNIRLSSWSARLKILFL